MCDKIIMHDGKIIDTISADGLCLCSNTQKEILTWIILHLPELQFDENVTITYNPFGYLVNISQSSNK